MVFVYAKQSELNKYIGEKLTTTQIKETLSDLGMDVKGESDEKNPELKIEITAERMDMVSILGVARAIKYYKGFEKKIPNYKVSSSGLKVKVEKSVEKVRPKTVAAVLRNIPMTKEVLDEIITIQEKMHDSFGRHRKKAAIGIYPFSKIKFPVIYKAEKANNIIFRPLESSKEMKGSEILEHHDTGKKFGHLLEGKEKFPIFIDSTGEILSMPPIINSHNTGRVEENHKDVFIEVSGHNITHLDNILRVLVTTFVEIGAKAQSVKVEYYNGDVYELNLKSREEKVSLDFINKLVGVSLSAKQVKELAPKVMYEVTNFHGSMLTFKIPFFKSDVWNDCDIADDIARAYGYNNIVPTFPNISSVGTRLKQSEFEEQVKETMISLGFLELYTYMLTSTQTQFKKFGEENTSKQYIKLIESAEQGINMTRVRILPELLESLRINRKNKYPQKVFEVGMTIQVDEEKDTGARNESHLAALVADPSANYTKIKEVIDTISSLYGFNFKFKELKSVPFLIEGRGAEIFLGKKSVGFIGEISPQVLENFSLLVPVCAFELILEDLI